MMKEVIPKQESRQKKAGVKVACRHRRQEEIREGTPRSESETNKGQPHTIQKGKEGNHISSARQPR